MPKKLTISECIKVARERGGECLSGKYINSITKMKWKCMYGHEWEAVFNSVLHMKSWCPYCAGKIRLSIEDCHAVAKDMGGRCLSTEYKNNQTKMKWECKKKHAWTTCFSHIKYDKTWCPYCVGQIKHTIGDCKDIARDRGGRCLSTVYENSSEPLLWECHKGHKWKARFRDINSGNKWCPFCSGNVRKTIDDCKELAIKNKGKCLSDTYTNNSSKLLWKCECGNEWKTTYQIVFCGSWCPWCSASKTQKTITNFIKDLFPNYTVRSNYRGFDWLKTKSGGKQELDIYIPEIKLAIEYDGEQHFKPVKYGSMSEEDTKNRLKMIKRLDNMKNSKIKKHPLDVKYFIRISYKEDISMDLVKAKIKNIGVKI